MRRNRIGESVLVKYRFLTNDIHVCSIDNSLLRETKKKKMETGLVKRYLHSECIRYRYDVFYVFLFSGYLFRCLGFVLWLITKSLNIVE